MLIPDTHPMILLCPSAKAAAADGEVSDGPAPVPASETNVTGGTGLKSKLKFQS